MANSSEDSSDDEEIDEDKLKKELLDCFFLNCLICRDVSCFDLTPAHPEDPDVMGDLYIGKVLCDKVHREGDGENLKNVICVNLHLFQAACFIVNSIPDKGKDNIILRESSFHATRDLKASIFLATSGYYRNSMQILRCSFETFLFGLYYQSDYIKEQNDKNKDKILKSYADWKKGGVVKRIDVMTEIYRRIGLISKQEEKEWKKLYGTLSKFIHTPKSTWGKKINETGFSVKITCMAYNIYDLEDFLIWSECFRKIYGILIKMCFILEPSIIKQEGFELAFDIFKEQSIDLGENDALNVLVEFIELKKNQYENS